jgi:hypothetical protein
MARNVWGVVSGLLVLAGGAIAVGGLVGSDQPLPEVAASVVAPAPAPAPISDQPTRLVTPELPGVPSRIGRVLEWGGDTGFAGDDELEQLPPTVAAVLIHYGVPLRIPVTGDGG